MRRQVVNRDRRSRGRQAACLARCDLPVVEIVKANIGQALQRRRKCRQPNELAGLPRPGVRAVDPLEAGRLSHAFADARHCRLDRRNEARPGRETLAGQLDRGREDIRPRQPPEPPMGVTPRAHRTGHRDRERTAQRQRRQASGAQRIRIGRGRRPAGAVQRVLMPLGRIPDQPERVATDPASGRHHDPQDRVRRDRGVDGGSTRAEDPEPGRRREVMRSNDRSTPASGKRGRNEHRPPSRVGVHEPDSVWPSRSAAVEGPPT
jgi:hypothetical protein